MSKLFAKTEAQEKHIGKILGSDSCVYQKGVILDRLITYEDMAAIVDYLRSQQESASIEPLRIEGADSLDINQMRKEFKELAAKWREKAGDADISVEAWSHTRGNPIQRYDAAPIIIDINCNVSVKELEL